MCSAYRGDGALLAAGCESSIVKVFACESKEQLRMLRGHSAAVRGIGFLPERQLLATASDDRSVCVWDVAAGSCTSTLRGHRDYVRSLCVSPCPGANSFATGSYDHTVRLWDARSPDGAPLTVSHGAPVEAVAFLPGGSVLVSAGGGDVKLWDVIGGGRLLQTLSAHQKTVTSVAADSSGSRLLSAGLDQLLKVHDLRTWEVLHTIKLSSPALSIALSPDTSHLAIGLLDGTLSLRHRSSAGAASAASGPTSAASAAAAAGPVDPQQPESRPLRGGTYRYFIRGSNVPPSADDLRVAVDRPRRLAAYDEYLREFRFGAALDHAVSQPNPLVTCSLIEELRHRGCLDMAISGKDDAALLPILRFVGKYATDPRFSGTLLDVAEQVTSKYARALGQSPLVDRAFRTLQDRIVDEVVVQRELQALLGIMDTLLASADSNALAAEAATVLRKRKEVEQQQQQPQEEEQEEEEEQKQPEPQPTPSKAAHKRARKERQ